MPDRHTVIVCGSRDGAPAGLGWDWVFDALGSFDTGRRIGHVIHGGAVGIDTMVGDWARHAKRPYTVFEADWERHKKAAGPVRNAEMLAFLARITDAATRAVLAFPGGVGTAHMVSIAENLSVPVWRCVVDGKGHRWVGP